jgi:hypothetical protein
MAASYIPEFMIDASGIYHEHYTRFSTEAEAEAYGRDLAYRVTTIRAMRVATSDAPPTHRWVDGRLIELKLNQKGESNGLNTMYLPRRVVFQ